MTIPAGKHDFSCSTKWSPNYKSFFKAQMQMLIWFSISAWHSIYKINEKFLKLLCLKVILLSSAKKNFHHENVSQFWTFLSEWWEYCWEALHWPWTFVVPTYHLKMYGFRGFRCPPSCYWIHDTHSSECQICLMYWTKLQSFSIGASWKNNFHLPLYYRSQT